MGSEAREHRLEEMEARSVRARLAELLGDGHEREVELVRRLVAGFPGKAARLLESMVDAGSGVDEAVHTVHALKGAALNLGSLELAALCQRVEEQLPARGIAAVAEQEPLLRDAVERFSRVLSTEGGSALPAPATDGGVR